MTAVEGWSRRPLSVTVLGNSIPLMQIPFRSRHGEGTFPEVLADRLVQAGVPTALHNECAWFEMAPSGSRRALSVLGRTAPDVLVVVYGVNEMQPWLMPVSTIRHLMRREHALTRTSRAYRQHVADPLWTAAKRYRKWAAPKVGLSTWQVTPERFRASLQLILMLAERTTRPLVLVVDVNPPGEIMRRYLPGVEARHEVVQRVIREVVAGAATDRVRLVEASRISEQLGVEAAMPDSIHWTPTAHAIVGELLAGEVLSWLAQGGHR